MIARKLLAPESLVACPSLRFADHTLFTGTIDKPYTCPPHIPGAGILTMLSGTGRFSLNDETITLDNTQYLLINRDSRLSIRLPRAETQPLFLFFRAGTVDEALTKYHTDLCLLERSHPMNADLKDRLEWLVRFGNSSSSFGALKADAMIRDMLLDLIRQALAAAATAERLAVSRQANPHRAVQTSLARPRMDPRQLRLPAPTRIHGRKGAVEPAALSSHVPRLFWHHPPSIRHRRPPRSSPQAPY